MAEPFRFMRYNEEIGRAGNLKQLASEVKRLSRTNPETILYHVRHGHVSSWLEATGQKKVANEIRAEMDISELLSILTASKKSTAATVNSGEKKQGTKKGTGKDAI